jgi:hypothetical protein
MVSLQKQLNNQSFDRTEQNFYTHTLEYLMSRSGKAVKVEDWMIASFEVDYGEEISAGGLCSGWLLQNTYGRQATHLVISFVMRLLLKHSISTDNLVTISCGVAEFFTHISQPALLFKGSIITIGVSIETWKFWLLA